MARLKMMSVLPGIVGLLMFVVSMQAQSNLITNGTFDTDASGWTLGGGGCTPATFDLAFGNPVGSVYLNACGETSSDPTAAQTVGGLTIGTTYVIQWDELWQGCTDPVCFGGGGGQSFGVYLDNQPGNPIALNEFQDAIWHTLTQTFVATSTSHTIIFAAELDGRTSGVSSPNDMSYYLDNVSLNAVPEPATFALLGIGLAGLGFCRRKRAS